MTQTPVEISGSGRQSDLNGFPVGVINYLISETINKTARSEWQFSFKEIS